MRSAAAFQRTIGLVPVDGDDAVGDVAEDGDAALPLERDLLVQLGLRVCDRGVRGERDESLDLLLLPGPLPAGEDREHALELALGAEERHREVRGVAAASSGSPASSASSPATSRMATGARELDHGPARPGVGRHSRARDLGLAGADCRGGDELVAVEQSDQRGIRAQQHRRLLDHLVEHRSGLELAREEAAGVGQLLGEQPRAPLDFEELAADERRLRALRELARQVEVVVGEGSLLAEEDERKRAPLEARKSERNREERRGVRRVAERLAEALVARQRGRGDRLARGGRAREHLHSGG